MFYTMGALSGVRPARGWLGERPARAGPPGRASAAGDSSRSSTCCTTCGCSSRGAELELMRESARIAARAHVRAMRGCRPGLSEFEIMAEIIHEFRRSNADTSYEPIVGGGANSCILHYRENDQALDDGDLLLIDAGCEYEYYASDITRTFPGQRPLHARAARGLRDRARGESGRHRQGRARAIIGMTRTTPRCASSRRAW